MTEQSLDPFDKTFTLFRISFLGRSHSSSFSSFVKFIFNPSLLRPNAKNFMLD